MSKINEFITNAITIAEDNTHGYDQINRWGPDYDCSSFLIAAAEPVFHVKTYGATYTGNMLNAFIKAGFKKVNVNLSNSNELIAGDVLLIPGNHTALYIGNGKIAEASINEKGTIKGGKTGDQTGREIWVHSYYNKGWTYVLRYTETQNIDQIAKDVINGKYGNGETRKQKIQSLGYNYEEVQKRVNEMLNNSKQNIDQIAKDVINGKYGNGETRKQKIKSLGYNYEEVQKRVNEMLK